jgi:hypothetical protein
MAGLPAYTNDKYDALISASRIIKTASISFCSISIIGGKSVEIKTPTKEERIAFHIRGVKMVLVPALFGALAGFLSSPLFLSPHNANFSFLVLAIAIYAQKFVLPPLGIDSSKFGWKDWFFLAFMTFCYWFMTWTIIINVPDGKPLPFGPFF